MARSARSSQLETRTARLKLAPRKKPYTVQVGPGVRMGYRRKSTAGSWSVIAADGKGGNWLKAFAMADDFEEANGETVLTYWQAQPRARILARGGNGHDIAAADAGKLVTVADALDDYTGDLKARGGEIANVARVRIHLPEHLKKKAVSLLTARELKRWRDGLSKTLTAGSVNRICNALRAALNLAANTDERITNHRAWEIGLQSLPDAVVARNVILPAEPVQRVVAAAYAISDEFGLLVETLATTGARVSQVARLEVQDVQGKRADPRLMMPSSRKGRGEKKISRRPVPIPESLAFRLRQAGQGRAVDAPLLLKPSGEAWRKSDHTRLFARAAQSAGLDPAEVTAYALRHSSIVRMLLNNVPIRVVATHHDTSTKMIETTYSKYIGDHADSLTRPTLLDLSTPASANVIALSAKSGRN